MNDSPTFNWHLQPISKKVWRDTLGDLFHSLSTIFIDKFHAVEPSKPHILLINTGFSLSFSEKKELNRIYGNTYEGAGEVVYDQGHLPVLFFATLQQQLSKNLVDSLLSFSTETGDSIQLSDWCSLKEECTRMGFAHLDDIRLDAEAVGFVDPVYRLDKLGEDDPKTFF